MSQLSSSSLWFCHLFFWLSPRKKGNVSRQKLTISNRTPRQRVIRKPLSKSTNRSSPFSKRLDTGKGVGRVSNSAGYVSYSLGQHNQAIEYYENSLDIARKLDDLWGEGQTLNDIGLAYNCLGENARAIGYFEIWLRQAM